jgi:hypothetical protein
LQISDVTSSKRPSQATLSKAVSCPLTHFCLFNFSMHAFVMLGNWWGQARLQCSSTQEGSESNGERAYHTLGTWMSILWVLSYLTYMTAYSVGVVIVLILHIRNLRLGELWKHSHIWIWVSGLWFQSPWFLKQIGNKRKVSPPHSFLLKLCTLTEHVDIGLGGWSSLELQRVPVTRLQGQGCWLCSMPFPTCSLLQPSPEQWGRPSKGTHFIRNLEKSLNSSIGMSHLQVSCTGLIWPASPQFHKPNTHRVNQGFPPPSSSSMAFQPHI